MRVNISPNAKFTADLVRDIIREVRPSGISNFDVEIKSSRYAYAGRAYYKGCGYHSSAAPLIVVRIGPDARFPIKTKYPGRDKAPDIIMGSRTEALVAVLAHELRHLWQHKQKNRRGYFPRTRGKFSEIDADAYALNKLRAWRKNGHPIEPTPERRVEAPVKRRKTRDERIALLKQMPGIADVEYSGPEGGWWAYTIDGFQFEGMGCHTAHADTLQDLIDMMKTIGPCDCTQCKEAKH